MWFVTDPARTPDTLAVARRLPRGAGVIFRHFGRPGAEALAHALAAISRARGLVLLIGADPVLAEQVGADGVHLPEREVAQAEGLKVQHPGWIITAAAHSARAARAALRSGADAALLSAIFPSRSPSAGPAIGTRALKRAVRRVHGPVYALGGVNDGTARRLVGTGVAGFAAVEAFS